VPAADREHGFEVVETALAHGIVGFLRSHGDGDSTGRAANVENTNGQCLAALLLPDDLLRRG
jgi:hypothetical protein